jgi:hypothetical protein
VDVGFHPSTKADPAPGPRASPVRPSAALQHACAQVEAFARDVHGSLDPTHVAYRVANEGRRLIGCDRLTVGLRYGRSVRVEAVSGADVIESRSDLVRRMRRLLAAVLAWGEQLVYRGVPDESLPTDVLEALNAYLALSNSHLLAVLPLRDSREAEGRRARSALLLESFEPAEADEQVIARLDAIGRHAAGALYNASEYRRIPLPWLWRPVAALRDGLGGPARVMAVLAVLIVAGLTAVLTCLPYPLKVDARGRLLPEERRWLYSPVEGQVIRFEDGVQPGAQVAADQSLVLLYDTQLEVKLVQLANEVAGAQEAIDALARQETAAQTEADRLRYSAEKKQKEFHRDRKTLERKALRDRTHADDSRPGTFWLTAPLAGTVLNSDFRETLTNRHVKPTEPLLRLGDKTKSWEVELKIPGQDIGRVAEAFDRAGAGAELDVDVLLRSAPTRRFRGKLARDRLASQATPARDDPREPEPVLLAHVRIYGPDIAESDRLPSDLLVSGTEAHCKVRCGDRTVGYSLFYGVWEFIYEKLVFAF